MGAQRVEGEPRRSDAAEDYTLVINTDVDPAELRERLRSWAPWRYALEFSNGVSTSEFEHGEFFVSLPLAKFRLFGPWLPDSVHGGCALDVGCNVGHNSMHLRRCYGMDVTGIDNSARNVEVARYLAAIGGFDRARFLVADARRFVSEQKFDLILCLSTLLFIRDPFLAVQNMVTMLGPGGCLVLETECYRDPGGDDALCKYHPHARLEDRGKPWWSLGRAALEGMLRISGCDRVEIVNEWAYVERMYRTMFLGFRGPSGGDAQLLAASPAPTDRAHRPASSISSTTTAASSVRAAS